MSEDAHTLPPFDDPGDPEQWKNQVRRSAVWNWNPLLGPGSLEIGTNPCGEISVSHIDWDNLSVEDAQFMRDMKIK